MCGGLVGLLMRCTGVREMFEGRVGVLMGGGVSTHTDFSTVQISLFSCTWG